LGLKERSVGLFSDLPFPGTDGNIGSWERVLPPLSFFEKQLSWPITMQDEMREIGSCIPCFHRLAWFCAQGLQRIFPNEELRN